MSLYDFIDVNEVSESILPSEALMINGDYIENLIEGYRTLQVTGREALSAELHTYESGVRDGSVLQSKRYPARYITVKYQLLAKSPEAFRSAFNQLASILNVEEAELIFNDEPDKFFIGTPEEIEEIPGGTNSVIGSFTIFCADPFKYSVQEYEAEPEIGEKGFLIDYNGTYKSYPTLEAEFYNENEALAALTGHGDCGYVAFFNEKEKIIQLGNPEEADSETYAKSQTLVSQKFNTATAWNKEAQNLWDMNQGKVSSDSVVQGGSVAIKTASYITTTAPSTSGTLISTTAKGGKPYIKYTVMAQTTARSETDVTVKVTIKTTPSGATSSTSITSGAKITLSNTKVYISSDATTHSSTKSGTFYLWDSSTKNGRIRITTSASYVGKSGKVTGWIDVSEISSSSSVSIKKGYGLKAVINFGDGNSHTVILKQETSTWTGNSERVATITVKVKDINATTTVLDDIRFKVERTDTLDGNMGVIEEVSCKEFEISSYTAPVEETWYLMPESYGTETKDKWNGPTITRTIPLDASGKGATNFSFSYKQKMSIGKSSTATQELGIFQALLISGSGSSRKIVAGVNIFKSKTGNKANLRFYVNNKTVHTMEMDLSHNNKYIGNNSPSKGITTVKTSSIVKSGNTVKFNIGGIKKNFTDSKFSADPVTQITFLMGKYYNKTALECNGLYWAKFVKNNCDTYEDIPNKFSANDIVQADCKSGEIFLNNISMPSLGALGNDWEDFYLSPGMNQIGYSYSDWVTSAYAPNVKIKYREVFI